MSALPEFKALWRQPVLFCALGFGSGLMPRAPGTWGSLLAVALYCVLFPWLSWQWAAGLLLLSFVLGVFFCAKASESLGSHDHSAVVWDEFVGQWMVLLYLDRATQLPLIGCLLVGIALFRLFDITKPWPIRWFDRNLQGGLGVMFDDVLAALMAILLVYLLARLALPEVLVL